MSPVTAILGDSREKLRELAESSVDACVTDPPYALVTKGPGQKQFAAGPSRFAEANAYAKSAGFMGMAWDNGSTAFDPAFWAEVLRVLKPGAHLLAFGGTRTFHRLACAIEDAGFEIRDAVMWHYGSGFPKSLDVSKAIDRAAGAEREVIGLTDPSNPRQSAKGVWGESGTHRLAPLAITAPATDAAKQWEGWGTALKPSTEIICIARKPLSEPTVAANVLRWGTGALNIGATRIVTQDVNASEQYLYRGDNGNSMGAASERMRRNGGGASSSAGRWPANIIHDGSEEVMAGFPDAPGQQRATGPEFERKAQIYGELAGVTPFEPRGDSGSAARFFYQAKPDNPPAEGEYVPNYKNNVYGSGMGGGTWNGAPEGRWPANLIHDGSEEVLAGFPEARSGGNVESSAGPGIWGNSSVTAIPGVNTYADSGSAARFFYTAKADEPRAQPFSTERGWNSHSMTREGQHAPENYGDNGSVARFFYTAKADADDRIGSKHPTVKPVDLMQYLVRLVCPRGGLVIDPFAGSGSTGEACIREGMRAILIEREPAYFADIERRIKLAMAGPEERAREIVKAQGKVETVDGLPLFGGTESWQDQARQGKGTRQK